MHPFPANGHPLAELVHLVFPHAPAQITCVEEGMSTYVYQIKYRQEIFYLRILPEEGASFAPEVAAHTQHARRRTTPLRSLAGTYSRL